MHPGIKVRHHFLWLHPTSQRYPLKYLVPLIPIPEALLLDRVVGAVWLGLLGRDVGVGLLVQAIGWLV